MNKTNKRHVIIENNPEEKGENTSYKKYLKSIFVILFYFLFAICTYLPFAILDINPNNIPDVLMYVYQISTEAIAISALIFVYRHDFIKYWNDFKKNGKKHLKFSLNCWFIGLGIMVISNLVISALSPISLPENEAYVREAFKLSPLLIAFSTIIQAPIIEEILFRKTFYDSIKNEKLFIVISGLIFGSLHILGVGEELASWLYVIPYAALGMTFAYILTKTKNLLSTIFIHAFHNFITIMLITLLSL